MRALFALAAAIALAASAGAATVHGTVYDFNLEPVAAIINVGPPTLQEIVAPNGTYSLELPAGRHEFIVIAATNPALRERQNLTISSDKQDYAMDFLLLPRNDTALAEALNELDQIQAVPTIPNTPTPDLTTPAALMGIAAIALAGYLALKYRNRPTAQPDSTPASLALQQQSTTAPAQAIADTPEELEIMRLLESYGGTATQKQLRKDLPYSEARVSLLVASLEKQGAITRMKVGRGNIIKIAKPGQVKET